MFLLNRWAKSLLKQCSKAGPIILPAYRLEHRSTYKLGVAQAYADPDCRPRWLLCDLSSTCKLTTSPHLVHSSSFMLNSFKKYWSVSTTTKRWAWKIHFTFIVIKQTMSSKYHFNCKKILKVQQILMEIKITYNCTNQC